METKVNNEGSRPKKRTTIYIEPNLWREFKKICFREDQSMSEKIQRFIARYVAVHIQGNPQLLLARFVGDIKKTCFFCQGKFPSLTKVKFISGLIAPVCRECLDEAKNKKRTVKKILGKV